MSDDQLLALYNRAEDACKKFSKDACKAVIVDLFNEGGTIGHLCRMATELGMFVSNEQSMTFIEAVEDFNIVWQIK